MTSICLADILSNTGSGSLSPTAICLLVVAIGLALAFEFVNGFHDTANAVATVIYTNAMRPWVAVIWSGCFNLIGVLCSSGAIAYTIMALLPAEMVTHVGSAAGFAMVFSILISAIIWNLGTWYLGLPASSTHTLTGAIVGVGLANSMFIAGHSFGDGVNWDDVRKVFITLLVSPVVGFAGAGLLILIGRKIIHWGLVVAAVAATGVVLAGRSAGYGSAFGHALLVSPWIWSAVGITLVIRVLPWKAMARAPAGKSAPPPAVRATLIATCTGVSFFHGSNDGQKGMGLVLLILIGIVPGMYALNLETSPAQIHHMQAVAASVDTGFGGASKAVAFKGTEAVDELQTFLKGKREFDSRTVPAMAAVAHDLSTTFGRTKSIGDLPVVERENLRNELYLSSAAITKLIKDKRITDAGQIQLLNTYKADCLDPATHNIPFWVKLATALALGLGTMIGWKRIVTTVGEKIGKEHLTYAQGASAELVAAATIAAAELYHMPVSTTHVLSSGVAGTMAASGSGVQMKTVRNLLLAWVLTLPVCVLLGAALFAAGLQIALNNLIPMTIIAVAVVGTGLVIWRLRTRSRLPAKKAPARFLVAQPG
jgi:PiT family inorganic phosphate transporter